MTRPYLISTDLGDVAGPALDKMVSYRKGDRSSVIRECVLLCYNFGLLKRFEGALRKAEKEKSPNVSKASKNPATQSEKLVVEKWREVYNWKGNIYWPKVLNVIRAAFNSGVPYEDMFDILELSCNDDFIGMVASRGETPGIPLILGESMLGKFVPMLEDMRKEMMVKHEVNLEGVVKPRAISQLKAVLSDDAMSQAYDLIMAATSEEQVNTVVKHVMQAQLDDYEGELERVGEWNGSTTSGTKEQSHG